ncbi:MAG: STAS/SEC14 domain-containing protein [Cyanobacteriota bacterium]
MINVLNNLSQDTVGFSFHETVDGHDVDAVLIPAVTEALSVQPRLKALLVFGPEFKGCTLAAAWDDTLLGLRHWDGFERLAVVSDIAWLRQSLRMMALLLPCPVRLFAGSELDQARRWLGESLGTIHLSQEDGLTTIRLIGRLDPEAYERIEAQLCSFFRTQPVLLLFDLSEFDGWLGPGALIQHFSLLRDHRYVPKRVALLAGPAWQRVAHRLLNRFVTAETRFFDATSRLKAVEWLVLITQLTLRWPPWGLRVVHSYQYGHGPQCDPVPERPLPA